MSAKLSYEEVRRLARIWFGQAREKSDQDEAEVAAWKKEQRKWSSFGSGGESFDAFDSGGDERRDEK